MVCVRVYGRMTISEEMHEIFIIELTNLCEKWERWKYKQLSVYHYIAATHDSLFAVFKSTHSKYRCDDDAVDRINKMKWSAANESVEPAADAGAHAIIAMALGQKAPHFNMHDSGHGRKFNVIHFNYTTPNANPITTSICI